LDTLLCLFSDFNSNLYISGETKEHWGSRELAESIRRARPQVHLHGHVKDCKGVIPAFGNYPLVVNGCVTNVDGNLIWVTPTVIKATQVNLDSMTNTVSWAFSLDALEG
jgi:Icc-related predicted phosphoesterase